MNAVKFRDPMVCDICEAPAIFKTDDGLACRQHVFADGDPEDQSSRTRRWSWTSLRSRSA